MSLRTLDKKTLLTDATSAGAGSAFGSERTKGWTFVVQTTVAGAATIDIEAYIGGAWFVVHSQDVTTTGSFMIRDDHGHYEKLRANVSAYTAGTHSVYATGTVDSL
jgi:hypothetical protein